MDKGRTVAYQIETEIDQKFAYNVLLVVGGHGGNEDGAVNFRRRKTRRVKMRMKFF